jgi:hypothetical protein
VAEGVAALQAELDAEGIAIRLRTGGELAIARAVELDDEELRGLRLGGGDWILAECPLSPSAAGFEALLHHLQRAATGSCSPIPSARRSSSAIPTSSGRSSTRACSPRSPPGR